MNCPKCNEPMKVTHTYKVPGGATQRLECGQCLVIATVEAMIVALNPGYGEGAAARAQRLRATARTQVVSN
jgi:hypothetical protein